MYNISEKPVMFNFEKIGFLRTDDMLKIDMLLLGLEHNVDLSFFDRQNFTYFLSYLELRTKRRGSDAGKGGCCNTGSEKSRIGQG